MNGARRKTYIAAIATALVMEEEEDGSDEPKRIWMKKWLQRRDERGCYSQIFNELRSEERKDFINYCRMPPELFFHILHQISPLICKEDTMMRDSIHSGARLEATLRWLASGGSYTSLQYSTRISKQSLSNIIPETCRAIYDTFKEEYMKTPTTTEEWILIAEDFQKKWQFPNTIGAVDGKHILINPPTNAGSYYYNYKGTHSIILLAMVNANLEFTYADVGINGRASDSAAWDVSNLKSGIENNLLNIPTPSTLPNCNKIAPYCILGDDAFPLKPYMMKPFAFRNQDYGQKNFSYRLSRARRTVENAFGLLANRFRVLLSPINLSPKKVESVILACLVLHNLLRKMSPEYTGPGNVDNESIEQGIVVEGNWRRRRHLLNLQGHPRNVSGDAKAVREQFKDYFLNEGSVPWQDLFVNRH